MLEEDAWYPRDLVGLEARMAEDNGLGAPAGLAVGKVVDVIDGAQSLLKIRLSDAYLASLALGRCACRGRCSFRTFLFASKAQKTNRRNRTTSRRPRWCRSLSSWYPTSTLMRAI